VKKSFEVVAFWMTITALPALIVLSTPTTVVGQTRRDLTPFTCFMSAGEGSRIGVLTSFSVRAPDSAVTMTHNLLLNRAREITFGEEYIGRRYGREMNLQCFDPIGQTVLFDRYRVETTCHISSWDGDITCEAGRGPYIVTTDLMEFTQ